MLKLIHLEWKKYHITKYIRNAGILIFILILFNFAMAFWGIANDPETGIPDMAFDTMGISTNIEFCTNTAFLIFASAMHAVFIISAYKDKTMELMFSYPIHRKKILVSKMLAVWIFSFIALMTAKLFCYSTIGFGFQFYHYSAFPIDMDLTAPLFYLGLTLKSAAVICISFIALFFGIIMKSSKAAIISSFLLVILMQGNIGSVSFRDNLMMPVILTIVSLIFALICILRAAKNDI